MPDPGPALEHVPGQPLCWLATLEERFLAWRNADAGRQAIGLLALALLEAIVEDAAMGNAREP